MIQTQTFSLPPVNRREILRYAGIREETPELTALLEEALADALPLLAGKVCWREFPLTWQEDVLDLGLAQTDSAALARNLAGCDRILVFAATLGLGIDRLITRCSRLSPAKAVLIQAIGAERIEALCDRFCEEIGREFNAGGSYLRPRFSPGYGDFPLDMQRAIFRVLDCPRQIGLTLNDSCLMSPSKSVTAILGLGSCPTRTQITGCTTCGKIDCPYRRKP